jgi:hypothetical protein
MPTATATAKTNAAALEARIAELEAQLQEIQSSEVRVTVWVNDRITSGTTKSGKPYVKFSAQKSVKNADGTRTYGAYWPFVAYGDLADQFNALRANEQNLLTIAAFESPWANNARKSDFVVTSIQAFERPEAPAPGEQSEPFSGEPTDEEVAF